MDNFIKCYQTAWQFCKQRFIIFSDSRGSIGHEV